MEKTLTIDGKQVRFKSTAATPLRYKAQFGSDYFADLMKMLPLVNMKDDIEKLDYETLRLIDFEVFYNIIWALAKTADKTIPEPIEWLDNFDEFPILEILPQLQDLIASSFQGKKKQ